MNDGKIHLTTIPSDVLGAIFSTLHDTAHREGASRGPGQASQITLQGGLTEYEQVFYNAVVAELQARVTENGSGEARK